MGFYKNRKYKLNQETADAALQNVLAACDRPPNTVPSDKLILRQRLYAHLYDRRFLLAAVMLILIFLLLLGIVPMAKLSGRQNAPQPVALINDYMEDGSLYLELSGDNILYEEAWMTAEDGDVISGIYDGQSGQIHFPIPGSGEYNIFIPVKNNEPFHLLLTL